MPLKIDQNLALPANEIFPAQQAKTGICLHHTVGGTAASSINHWKTDNAHVGTAYMIGRDGTVFEIFDPKAWAFQFGLKGWSTPDRFAFEKRFIGIEIASEGGLTESEGNLYCFDRVSTRTRFARTRAFDSGADFRGYRYFAQYKKAQVDSVIALVNHLCDTLEIKRQIPKNYLKFHGQDLKNFEGVIGHIHVRTDKTDPIPDNQFWERVINGCGLARVEVGAPPSRGGLDGGQVDLVSLFEDNVQQIVKMAIMSGSMVKQLILELQRPGRDTHIRLRDAEVGGHTVFYSLVEGDPALVTGIANALDVFSEVTVSKLVVLS